MIKYQITYKKWSGDNSGCGCSINTSIVDNLWSCKRYKNIIKVEKVEYILEILEEITMDAVEDAIRINDIIKDEILKFRKISDMEKQIASLKN